MFNIWMAHFPNSDTSTMIDWNLLKIPLAVFIGGGLGSVARWGVSHLLGDYSWAKPFPWPTFLINVLGSLILGILAVVTEHRPGWYALLGLGFCGGFTTFSTFSVETVRLLEKSPMAAVGYAVASVLSGVFGAWLGLKFFR